MKLSLRIWRIALGLISLFLASLLFCQPRDGETATVRISLVGLRGRDLGIGTVALFQERDQGSKNLAYQFQDNTATKIPFGMYNLRIFKKGYASSERVVSVHQSNVWIVVQLYVGEENGPLLYTIAGSVEGPPPSKNSVWIRAQGLYSDVIADTRVDGNGAFQLAGLPPGIYILSTRQDNDVLDLRSIAVPPPEQKAGTIVRLVVKIK